MITKKEIEKAQTIAFYQTAWGRYYFLKHEILKIKATVSQHENSMNDINDVEKCSSIISEMFYLKFLSKELIIEFEHLEAVLDAKKWIQQPEKA